MAFTNSQQPTKHSAQRTAHSAQRTAHSAQRTAHSAQRKIKLKYLTLIFVMALFVNSQQLKAQTSPNIVPANGNAGFGTTTPTEKVEINGKLKVIDKAIFKNDVTIEDDLKIKSLENFSISANRILGINPNGKIIAPSGLLLNNSGYKLDITGNLKVGGKLDVNYITVNDTAYLKTIATNRIKSLNGDSLIHFGDSSITLNHINHRIYSSIYSYTNGLPFSKGFSIGAFNNVYANGSFAIGNFLQTKLGVRDNIIIGSGYSEITGDKITGVFTQTVTPFINDKSNSLMIGFNSIVPTLYVGPNETGKSDGVGKVGIATKNPQASLDVNGNVRIQSLAGTSTRNLAVDPNGYLTIATNSTTTQWQNNGTTIYYNTGNVGIGTSNTGSYKLAVEGKVGAREFKVTQTNPWPDFVFEKEYALLSLEETEKFIQKNKHLPGVPSAKQIEENGGVDIGELNRILLQKVEELTLQLIQQKKEIDELKIKTKN